MDLACVALQMSVLDFQMQLQSLAGLVERVHPAAAPRASPECIASPSC